MEKNLNPLYYLEEAIGGAGARRLLKSAKKHKKDVGNIINFMYDKGTGKARSISTRLSAKHLGNMGKNGKEEGQKQIQLARKYAQGLKYGRIQGSVSELDRKIASRKPGDFAKQFKKDKIKRFRKENTKKGKDLLDSFLKHPY